MKILAIEQDAPGRSAADFSPYLRAEAAAVYTLQQAGIIREIYFRADCHAAVIMLECASLDEAREALDSLPLVSSGLIRFEIIQLLPYPGFARLFGQPSEIYRHDG